MIAAVKFLSRATRSLALALVLLPGVALAASPEDALSAADRACLDCHGSAENAARNAAKSRDGQPAPVIQLQAYLRSVHAEVGCDGCHDGIDPATHPGKLAPVKAAASPALGEACRSCHAKVVKAYARSFHAQRLLAGKKKAPDCNDCHTPHAVTSASVQEGAQNVCLDCHDDPAQTHQAWLPNAARHLQAVACAACHAPGALPRVDLRLSAAGGDLAARFEEMAQAADANHDGLDAHEFRALLQAFERQGTPVAVRGRIELRSGVQAHALPDKSGALRDCFGCHDPGAAPYKSVSVSTLDALGAPLRYDAQREILTSAITIEALEGFYVLGGTRLAQLDWLLAGGLALGISVPGLHFLARRVLRRLAGKKE